jgi:hypothetical protein
MARNSILASDGGDLSVICGGRHEVTTGRKSYRLAGNYVGRILKAEKKQNARQND